MNKPNKKQTALAIAGGILAYVLGGKLFNNKKEETPTDEGASDSSAESDNKSEVIEATGNDVLDDENEEE